MNNDILSIYGEWLKNDNLPPGKKKTLQAALELFSEQGYNGTSTAQIATKAGVSQATIFKYFKTKEELLYSIVAPVLPEIFGQFIVELKQYTSLEEAVAFIIHDRYQFLVANQLIIKIIIQELFVNNDIKNRMKELFVENQIFEQLTDWIEMLRSNNSQFRRELVVGEVIRIFISQLFTYFAQGYILDIPLKDEKKDLDKITAQTITLLSEN